MLSNNLFDRLVYSQRWDGVSYPPANLTRKYPNAPIKEGDVVALRSGWHGNFSLAGGYNTFPITIMADVGHLPRVEFVKINAAANWRINCLTVG